jgi:hypothetical protein
VQPLAKWVREVGTEPTGGVVLPSSEVDVLRTLIARSGDWSALAEHRAELRVEVVALLAARSGWRRSERAVIPAVPRQGGVIQ